MVVLGQLKQYIFCVGKIPNIFITDKDIFKQHFNTHKTGPPMYLNLIKIQCGI